jgi:PAS domain S-box-containing protein
MTTAIDSAQLLAACARELLCLTDRDGHVLAAAGPWQDVVGLPASDVPGAALDAFVHEDDRPALRAYHSAVLAGEPHDVVDVRLLRGDRVFDVALRRADERVVASLRDVTAQRLADQALALLNDELQRSNDELQRFAYVASHDLSEPLRMVTSYCGLLAEDHAGVLDETGREYLAFAVDGAVRMRTLIDDLLAYSRVSWVAAEPSRVSLDDVFGAALRDLGVAVQDAGADIVIEPLPDVLGNPAQLGQLAANLLGNALKFRTPGTVPRVTVSAGTRGAKVTLSVADNGIGIPDKHRERVFVMFKRLHGRGAYGGNGIGLALCKRIAELHGGAVWVEEAPGGGSVFHVTLVAAADAA